MRLQWLGLFAAGISAGAAAATWSLEGSLGAAYNAGTRLTIEQEGEERLSLSARYATRSFESPLYYGIRLSRWDGPRAWELSLIHDKLYLRNPPLEVENLAISHGFNLITLNRSIQSSALTYRLGAGVIVTHPEGRVRGRNYDGPYDLAGAVALAGASKRFYGNGKWFVVADSALTVGYAKTHAGGDRELTLTVPHAAVHALLGVGRNF